MDQQKKSIGIFDSGYGGLTVYKEIVKQLPDYNYIYLGDNARTPYGTRSFETVYRYTRQCVDYLFKQECNLIILACNTSSAKALRSIQQKDLKNHDPIKRVLGVIRPTAEIAGSLSKTQKLGILATEGTVNSKSYILEIKKFFPNVDVYQQTCPMWVPLVEHNEHAEPGADYFIKKYVDELLAQSSGIDCVLLACTHYPLLEEKIRKYMPQHINIISQGELVGKSLKNYLLRHTSLEKTLAKDGSRTYLTTDIPENFNHKAGLFLSEIIDSKQCFVEPL